MAETVTVAESQGPRYTWANASFTWSSAGAGKSWLTAYPAVYVVAVAATLALVEASNRQHGKRLSETVSLAETRRFQVALQKTESLEFADTYYDLIAYVLRWVESLGVAESVTMQNFTDIPSSRTLSDSLIEILNNDKTAISCNSGTTFPTTNQQVGMLCYRTDQLKLYQLIGTNPDNWRFIMDLASGIDAQFAAKLNAAAYTAADVLAKLLSVDGSGSGLDADLLDGQHASAFASASHNHNATYLGISAKATDSDRLDGYDSSAFVRSVNGGGPDANGNATVSIDLSGRVARTGDSMSGRLTLPSQTVQSTSPTIDFYDTDQGSTRYLHVNSNLMGFLKTDGNWDMYMNNGGSMWTANYGWLHDYFFRQVANCGGTGYAINCYGSGNITSRHDYELIDEGGQLRLRTVNVLANCNCNCNCCGC